MKFKLLLTLALTASAAFLTPAWSAAPASSTVTGEVLEVKNVAPYTYLRLKTKQGESWAAVNTAALKPGMSVTLENVSVMKDFESKILKKTFPTILFGTLAGAGGPDVNPKTMADAHGGVAKATDTGPIKVAKASGPNARTVAEVVTQAAQLKDKPVKVSGKVVKYNASIMGKNWIHLQDGTGSAASNTHDVLVTSTAEAKVGEVITITGIVRNDRDLGAGYVYKVLVEDATLQR